MTERVVPQEVYPGAKRLQPFRIHLVDALSKAAHGFGAEAQSLENLSPRRTAQGR